MAAEDYERVGWRVILYGVVILSLFAVVIRLQANPGASLDGPLLMATIAAVGLACSTKPR
jgi:hypothetical protein